MNKVKAPVQKIRDEKGIENKGHKKSKSHHKSIKSQKSQSKSTSKKKNIPHTSSKPKFQPIYLKHKK